jgi:ABC-2 type transport system ATP-binding protein
MKQKLGLACTLVRPPRLLLLDEPTVGVDPLSRRELWAIVYRLVRNEGMSVLLSTAYLDEAERCDAVILLHQGQLLGQGPPGEFSEPLTGHSYLVTVDGVAKRALQTRLAALEGVVDAVVQGERVRVVMREAAPPDLSALEVPSKAVAKARPVAPKFEDGFISLLRRDAEARAPGAPPMPAPATAAGDRSVISVEGVKRRFGDFYAVKGVSFEVHRGEVFGLLGANGAGKTTTFRMLCGLLPASEGRLQVAGHDLRRAAAQARGRIGYMAQRFSLYGNLSVEQNLGFFASAYGLHRQARRERIRWALQGFDLTAYADAASSDLPLGYKQRLAMAAALMHEPDILFLDEPTSGVDPLARREFWHRISLLAEQGVTVLVTTHFMDEANYCDRLLIMADGETLAQGTPEDMKTRFRSEDLPDPTMEDAFIGLIEQRGSAAEDNSP